MNFIYVASTDINAIGINGNNLVIRFNSGGTYEYIDAAKEFKKILNANSKGKYFHQYIKNQYKAVKIN